MVVSFARNWEDEIFEITGSTEYQSCEIEIVDPAQIIGGEYDWKTDTYSNVTDDGVVYSGQARFIPIRAGVPVQGEAQANSTTIRAVRFQLPKDATPFYIRKGLAIEFIEAERNLSLVGRTAHVQDDFQGSSAATRTFSAMMDIDSGGPADGP